MHSRIFSDLCSASGRQSSTLPIRTIPEDIANLNTIFREKGFSSFLLRFQMLRMRRPCLHAFFAGKLHNRYAFSICCDKSLM